MLGYATQMQNRMPILTPQQIYSKHENVKKQKYAERILQTEQGTKFTPLILTTNGEMAQEGQIFYSRLT